MTRFSHMSDPVFAISQDLIPPKKKKTPAQLHGGDARAVVRDDEGARGARRGAARRDVARPEARRARRMQRPRRTERPRRTTQRCEHCLGRSGGRRGPWSVGRAFCSPELRNWPSWPMNALAASWGVAGRRRRLLLL